MTTRIEIFEFRTPSGKTVRTSKKVSAADVARLEAEADAWHERNKHRLGGYSVADFLDEKRRETETDSL